MKEHWYATMIIECPKCKSRRSHVTRIFGQEPWNIDDRKILEHQDCTKCKLAEKYKEYHD